MKGWGPKSSVCPSKPGKSNFLGRISRDFPGISRQCPKSLRKKDCVQSISPEKEIKFTQHFYRVVVLRFSCEKVFEIKHTHTHPHMARRLSAADAAREVEVETLAFGHLHLDVTIPRVVLFRDAILDLLSVELGATASCSLAIPCLRLGARARGRTTPHASKKDSVE